LFFDFIQLIYKCFSLVFLWLSGKEEFKVTPWEVEGFVDYERLIKEFGVEKISISLLNKIKELANKKGLELPLLLRRGFYYAHRDLNFIIDDYLKGKNVFLYTGRGPSGKMHIGHLPSFLLIKFFQDLFDCNVYIMFSDDEKFLEKNLSLKEINEKAEEQILQISALGFNPNKTFIFKNTEFIPKIYKDILKVAKLVNFQSTMKIFGFNNHSNIGIIFYPAIQIVPTFFEKGRVLIPAAIDQDPYFRLQRDIASKLSKEKAASIYSKFFPPLQGPKGKMSSSKSETAIFLDDDEKTIELKIKKYAFSGGRPTLEEHRKYGGIPEIDVSFQYLKLLFEPDDNKLKEIEENYKKGILTTAQLKKYTIEKITEYLKEFQNKVEKAKTEKLKEKIMYDGKLAKQMWEREEDFI